MSGKSGDASSDPLEGIVSMQTAGDEENLGGVETQLLSSQIVSAVRQARAGRGEDTSGHGIHLVSSHEPGAQRDS